MTEPPLILVRVMASRVQQLEAENARLQNMRAGPGGPGPDMHLRSQLEQAVEREHALEAQVYRLQALLDERCLNDGPLVKMEQVDEEQALSSHLRTPASAAVAATSPAPLRNSPAGKDREKSHGVALTFVRSSLQRSY